MLKVPEQLLPYISFYNGDVIAVNLPSELKEEFEKFKEFYDESRLLLADNLDIEY